MAKSRLFEGTDRIVRPHRVLNIVFLLAISAFLLFSTVSFIITLAGDYETPPTKTSFSDEQPFFLPTIVMCGTELQDSFAPLDCTLYRNALDDTGTPCDVGVATIGELLDRTYTPTQFGEYQSDDSRQDERRDELRYHARVDQDTMGNHRVIAAQPLPRVRTTQPSARMPHSEDALVRGIDMREFTAFARNGGQCCTASETGGCSNSTSIESCVCSFDDFCCSSGWDSTCVQVAAQNCGDDCGEIDQGDGSDGDEDGDFSSFEEDDEFGPLRNQRCAVFNYLEQANVTTRKGYIGILFEGTLARTADRLPNSAILYLYSPKLAGFEEADDFWVTLDKLLALRLNKRIQKFRSGSDKVGFSAFGTELPLFTGSSSASSGGSKIGAAWIQPSSLSVQITEEYTRFTFTVIAATIGGVAGLALALRDCFFTDVEPGERRFRFLPAEDNKHEKMTAPEGGSDSGDGGADATELNQVA